MDLRSSDLQPIMSAATFSSTVAFVNSAAVGWEASIPTQFNSFSEVSALCGAILDDKSYPILSSKQPLVQPFPTDFDTRTKWNNCTIIAKVGSQAGCGDCWAWSATQTFESYSCIKGTLNNIELSKEDTAECCNDALCGYSQSCTAGTPFAALTWMAHRGVVTGGSFNSSIGCKPYSLAPCKVTHNPNTPLPACHEPHPPPTLTCQTKCENPNYTKSYVEDKFLGGGGLQANGLSYRDDNNTHAMQYMLENGPIAATFSVMEDFPTYKGGIYKHTTGKFLGGHAITIVGWGVGENNTAYWTVKNSWSEFWGEKGYFRIQRGVNMVGIESQLSGLSM